MDHFRDCDSQVIAYNQCMKDNLNKSAHCQDLAKEYLQCRMDHGLMAQEDLNHLGFARKQVPPDNDSDRVYGDYERDPSKPYIAGLSRVRPRSGGSNFSHY